MDPAEARRLIAAVADDPPSDVREVRRIVAPFPAGGLPAPEAAELRMRRIRVMLPIKDRTAHTVRESHDTNSRRYGFSDDAQ